VTARTRVVVDDQMCAATGYCVRVSPALFALTGPGGTAQAVADVDSDERVALAEQAEVSCPTGAIWQEPA
jgi:ferredoxin